MNFKKEILQWSTYLFLGIFSFLINYWTGSRGVFSIDTFVHFDSAVRILKDELPIRDFWIVHGFLIDYIQALFFKVFGVNWKAYILHGSAFNIVVTLLSFKIFNEFNIDKKYSIILSICLSVLAYPVSGTPFLDLHSAFFSMISMYLILISIKKESLSYLFIAIIFLGLAFLSKQVPAGYFIILVTIFLLIYSYQIKSYNPLFTALAALIVFLLCLFTYLILTNTNFNDFILQLFIFPNEIAGPRFKNYTINLGNIFLNIKFIYLFLIPIIILLLLEIFKKKSKNIKQLNYLLIIIFFSISLIFHQIYTKNQIFIFFLIPFLCAFLIYFLNNEKFRHKKYLNHFLVLICIILTFKYHLRYNEDRKFHELFNTNLDKGIEVDFNRDFFKGLKWITPAFNDPKKELEIIKNFYIKIKKDETNFILITKYTFFSGLLDKSVKTPSRTFDRISYPRLNSKYYKDYKNYFNDNIVKNNIENIYVFNPGFKLTNEDLSELIFNYIPKNCHTLENFNSYTYKINLSNCDFSDSK